MQPVNSSHGVAFSRPPRPKPPAARLRPPSDQHQKIFKNHCQYELRRNAHGTTIVARPLSQAAVIWLTNQRVDELRMACHDTQAAAWIRSIEAAIDTSLS